MVPEYLDSDNKTTRYTTVINRYLRALKSKPLESRSEMLMNLFELLPAGSFDRWLACRLSDRETW